MIALTDIVFPAPSRVIVAAGSGSFPGGLSLVTFTLGTSFSRLPHRSAIRTVSPSRTATPQTQDVIQSG